MRKPALVVPAFLFFAFLLLLCFSVDPYSDRGSGGPVVESGAGSVVGWDWMPASGAVARAQGILEQVSGSGAFYLTFPHTANGIAAGLRCRSSIVLVNNSETNASGRIELFRQDGAPFQVGTNQGIDHQFDFTLFPGESYRLETDGTGNLTTGWIQVVSDIALSGSGTFVITDGAGKFLSEVGVGDSRRSGSLMIFVERDASINRDTSVGICNPSDSSSASVSLELRKLDGSVISTRTGALLLPPRGQLALFVRELFPGVVPGVNWSNFKGILVVRSDDVPLGVVTLRTRGSGLTSLPAASQIATNLPWRNLAFARIGDGVIGPYRFQTSIILLNPSGQAISTKIETFSETGTPASLNWGTGALTSVNVTVPSGGAVELNSDGSNNPAVVGWARTASSSPIAGSALFNISEHPSGAFVSQTGVPDSPKSPKITIFGQVSSSTDTGFGLTNLSASEVPFTLRLYRTNGPGQFGTFLSQKELRIPGLGHTARFISEFFGDVPEVRDRNFEGTVVAECYYPWDFAALTLRTRGAFFTSLPVAPFTPAIFAPKFTLLASTLQEGTRPCACFRITQTSGDLPLKEAVITFDKGQFDLGMLGAPGTHGEFLEFLNDSFLFLGRVFVHDSSGDSVGVFSLVTADGVIEGCPALYTLRNLAGGGIEVRINSSYPAVNRFMHGTSASLCLEPGGLLLPAGKAQNIQVVQEFESWEQDLPEGGALRRNARSSIGIRGTNPGQPRIDSITPHRVKGGAEVEIRGANFSPMAADNQVILSGKVNFPSTAEVLEASAERLRVRLPVDAKGSELSLNYRNDLRVAVAGSYSVPYHIGVVFSPLCQLSFSNLAPGAASTLQLSVTQGSVELGLMETVLKASAGSWITSGFTAGQVLGTLTYGYSYDVKVVSSSASALIMEAVRSGSQVPAEFALEATAGAAGQLRVALVNRESSYLTGGAELVLGFNQPVFRMPAAGGSVFHVDALMRSLPERTQVSATAVEMGVKLDFKTN